MDSFTRFVHRWLFNLTIKWNSLGVWSRLRGKNKVMAHLLRRRPKTKVFFRLGRFFIIWAPRRFREVSSRGICLPNSPIFSNKTIIKTVVFDMSQLKPTKVVFDDRPTNVVLDELRAAKVEQK